MDIDRYIDYTKTKFLIEYKFSNLPLLYTRM